MRPVAVTRGRWTGLAALAGYTVIAGLFLGVPLLVESGSRYVGLGPDPQIFIWSFAWWPHAILHWENPFFTRLVWAPAGINLTWTSSVPGLALLFAPLTFLAGPIVSYNVAAILMPALAAWTAFLLCRYLTHAIWPSLVGGYLFGFSSYLLAQAGGAGHMHLSSVFLLPLVALLVLRFLDGELDGRGFVIRLGPSLALQILMGTEVTFSLALAVSVALVLGFALVPVRRRQIVSLLPYLAGAYAVAAVLTAPFLYYALTGFVPGALNAASFFIADLANFAVPTKVTFLGGGWASAVSKRFPGNLGEQDAYLGLPTLLIVGLFTWRRVRTASGRFLLAAFLAGVVASLGASATFDGHGDLVWLPWRLVESLPAFDNVLASRLVVYVSLVAAVMVALWTAGRRGLLRWLLPALAVLAIVPNPAAGGFATRYDIPRFFTDGAYRSCIDNAGIVLPLPIRNGEAPLWQAASGFRITLAGGDIAPYIPSLYLAPGAMSYVTGGLPVAPDQAATLRTFIATAHVSTVIVEESEAANWAGALDEIAKPQTIGGALIYRVGPGPLCTAA